MVGQNSSPSMDNCHLRKTRKPLVEKRRRDRINTSILQLKALLAQSLKNESAMAKLDKADILDVAVSHLSRLQTHQDTVAMATRITSYNAGFGDCARETIRFLGSTKVVGTESLCGLSEHLQNVIVERSKQPKCEIPIATTSPQQRHVPTATLDIPPRFTYFGTSGMAVSPNSSIGSDSNYSSDVSSSSNDDISCHIIKEEKPWRPW